MAGQRVKQVRVRKRLPQPPAKAASPIPQAGSLETLKENLKRIDRGGLAEILNEVRVTKPEEWKEPEKVRGMAQRFAKEFKLPVSNERLNSFVSAYRDAVQNAPSANLEEMVKRYAPAPVGEDALKEMKKFIKPSR